MDNIEKLINVAECLCDAIRCTPSGCEGCPLWNKEEYEEYFKNENEDNYKCDFEKIVDRYSHKMI